MSESLVKLRELRTYYPVKGGVFRRKIADVRAVDGIDLDLAHGECLGLVGESGCGKSTLGKSILRLLPVTSGCIRFDGLDLLNLRGADLRRLRRRMQMVFQDPMNSLDPRMLVKDIVAEPLVVQSIGVAAERRARVRVLLEEVGLGQEHGWRYPHEFSGGQRQRIAVARALATQPDFILLDEPTSALDVSVQARILNLLQDLRQRHRLTYLFVTHNLLVVRYMAQRIAVMYLGRLVEEGPTESLFEQPRHPYTRALLSAIPIPEPGAKKERTLLSGDVPNAIEPPSGCRFHPRCPHARDICRHQVPATEETGNVHRVACHRWREV